MGQLILYRIPRILHYLDKLFHPDTAGWGDRETEIRARPIQIEGRLPHRTNPLSVGILRFDLYGFFATICDFRPLDPDNLHWTLNLWNWLFAKLGHPQYYFFFFYFLGLWSFLFSRSTYALYNTSTGSNLQLKIQFLFFIYSRKPVRISNVASWKCSLNRTYFKTKL